MILKLIIEGGGALDFEVKKLLNGGYTARDQNKVSKQIEEERKQGIPTPKSIPAFFPKIAERITTADKIEVLSENTTSGEAEFVLLFDQSNIYVGVGSDHTDRKLEQYSILAAKHMCDNVISKYVWLYKEVEDHWDDLILRSWVEKEGKRNLYQETNLKTYMQLDELINCLKAQVSGDLSGLIFYAGTVPLVDGEMCFSSWFEAELIDRQKGRSLSCAYSVEPISWFKGDVEFV